MQYMISVATKSVSQAVNDAVATVKGTAGVAPSGKVASATQTTGPDGSTTFSLNAKSSGRNAVYLL